MRRPALTWLKGGLAGWLAAGVSVSAAVLIGLGWQAVHERHRSETLLAERRAREAADRFVTALSRDMRGVQDSILPAWWSELTLDPRDDVRKLVSSAFAKYPYPESFFAWRSAAGVDAMPFYNRSDRRPDWMPPDEGRNRFPVSIGYQPAVARALLGRIRADAGQGRRFSIFETMIGGTRYQVVARLVFRDAFREHVEAVVGFTVNLAWVREQYFPEVARQVARIDSGPAVAIVDERGQPVWGARPDEASGPVARRAFPVMFCDPLLVEFQSPADLSGRHWIVEVGASSDPAPGATGPGDRTLVIATVAGAALLIGLLLTARASLAGARLSGMRSEFVSTVTHELKTPIATIRAIGDTLARGRVADPQALQEYALLVVQEAKRLGRLVENLLAYARITDVTQVYAFEPLDLGAAVASALRGFHTQLADAGFEVSVDLPPDLPMVRADRTAIRLVLDNLLDNAMRYSGTARWLQVRARRDGGRRVVVEVSDRGVGIPASEMGQVTRRFVRGRSASSSGTGLGLAIVSRIAADHGGALTIDSVVGKGTTAAVALPVTQRGDAEAHSHR